MAKENITYREVKLNMEYLPGKDRDARIRTTVKVQAPQYVECTYDVGLRVLEELGTTCFSVYMALLSYRNSLKNDCHPSVKRIHEDFNIGESTIKKCINTLYDKGYLDINSGYKDIANNYYFTKEYWNKAWSCDFYQKHAERNKGKSSSITEHRKTKTEQENETLKEEAKEKDAEIERLKKLLEQQGVQTDKQNQNWCKDLEDDLPY